MFAASTYRSFPHPLQGKEYSISLKGHGDWARLHTRDRGPILGSRGSSGDPSPRNGITDCPFEATSNVFGGRVIPSGNSQGIMHQIDTWTWPQTQHLPANKCLSMNSSTDITLLPAVRQWNKSANLTGLMLMRRISFWGGIGTQTTGFC